MSNGDEGDSMAGEEGEAPLPDGVQLSFAKPAFMEIEFWLEYVN
jgi:hypothetical protein